MKRLVWLEFAILDLAEINAYYSDKVSPETAAKIVKRIHSSATILMGQPYLGIATMDEDIFEWYVPDLPYTLPYIVNGDDIEILRVFHQSQNKPSKWG